MRQVAGSLRLDLAQFRELAAFAQFASDLDKATRSRIDRGRRLTEVLKQPQYQPVPVEKQVMIIYAATNGYLDDVPVDKVTAWEAAFYRYMDANHPEIGQAIIDQSVKAKNKMSDELLQQLRAAIEEFKQTAAPGGDEDQLRRDPVATAPGIDSVGFSQNVSTFAQALCGCVLRAIDERNFLSRQSEGCGRLTSQDREPPGLADFMHVRRAHDKQVWNGAQRRELLNGLMRGAVVAQSDRIMCEDIDDLNF